MSKSKRIIIYIIFGLLCFSTTINYNSVRILASNDQAIYFIVVGNIRDGQLGNLVPETRILKYQLNTKEEAFKNVQLFDSVETSDMKIYHDYGFLRIDTRDYSSYEDKSID